jgi:hypothetical protein
METPTTPEPTPVFDFSHALRLLRDDHLVRRLAWNFEGSVGPYVKIVRTYRALRANEPVHTDQEIVTTNPPRVTQHHLVLSTSDHQDTRWTPSVTDIFANDWVLV